LKFAKLPNRKLQRFTEAAVVAAEVAVVATKVVAAATKKKAEAAVRAAVVTNQFSKN
jgi:hypothetical protein